MDLIIVQLIILIRILQLSRIIYFQTLLTILCGSVPFSTIKLCISTHLWVISIFFQYLLIILNSLILKIYHYQTIILRPILAIMILIGWIVILQQRQITVHVAQILVILLPLTIDHFLHFLFLLNKWVHRVFIHIFYLLLKLNILYI